MRNFEKITTIKFVIILDRITKNSIHKRSYSKHLKVGRKQPVWLQYDNFKPTGCIKQNFDISRRAFNLLLQNVSLHDQIVHLYAVDAQFDNAKAIEKQIVYNEIYPPFIEKQKIINRCQRSVFQLPEQYSAKEKGNPKSYRATKKAHTTLLKKISQCI